MNKSDSEEEITDAFRNLIGKEFDEAKSLNQLIFELRTDLKNDFLECRRLYKKILNERSNLVQSVKNQIES
jgi:hypothetical protein